MMRQSKLVKLYRWRSSKAPFNNFGDEITVLLLDRLFGIKAVPVEMHEAELLGSGSILDAWALKKSKSAFDRIRRFNPWRGDLHVWGSGFILPDTRADWPQRLVIHAVRGKLSADRTTEVATLGDPGILASTLLDRTPDRDAAIGFVPHHIDAEHLRKTGLPADWKLIKPEAPVTEVINSIASCEIVISSSLHGLITADSFGIPCVWAQPDRLLYGNTNFKFHDYASARGEPFNEAVSCALLFAMNAEQIASICTVPNRSMEAWQRELVAAFPGQLR